MNPSDTAQPVRAARGVVEFTLDDRHWRVRGLEKQLSCERLKVNVMVTRDGASHVDTLDLYTSRQRRMFVREAAAELYLDEALIKKDLGHLLRELEAEQDRRIGQTLEQQVPEVPAMTDTQRREALAMLGDPRLLDRIAADFEACGLVGEATNRLVCYLACVSRHLDRPLAVLVQSSSGAGKTTLQDAVLRLMPPESQVRLSAMTGQSLYYMGATALRHKILAIAEEEGVAEASYALKLLQSEGQLTIASAEKDRDSGRQVTRQYRVQGPVAMLLTTTSEHPDAELANRCLVLRVSELPRQTAAIHQRQRAAYMPVDPAVDCSAIVARHQNAQRLLEPLAVVIPWADRLTYPTDQTCMRRSHANYLALIASITLLHQYQRERTTRIVDGTAREAVAATREDIAWANRLAHAVLQASRSTLLPQTRQLLEQLSEYVRHLAQDQAVAPLAIRFTQREVRDRLGWSDRALRRQLRRLVELEYVLMYRTGRGNQRLYQLVEASPGPAGRCRPLGLVDAAGLDP